MHKNSQAALEFLTTYAWAFLVITITIGALYSFGVLDFAKYLPQKCIFPSQFKCLDFSLRPSEVRIKLTNDIGEDVSVTSVRITNDANPAISCTAPFVPIGWIHSADTEFVFSSCSGGAYIADSRVDLKITLQYYAVNTPSKPVHTIQGKVNGIVAQV